MSDKLVICDGKYTFILPDNDYRIKVLRYNEEWLWIEAGSKAVGSLVIKHIEAQQALAELRQENATLKDLLRKLLDNSGLCRLGSCPDCDALQAEIGVALNRSPSAPAPASDAAEDGKVQG